MQPQHKHAVLVMVESIEAQLIVIKSQLVAVKGLLAADGNYTDGGHKSTKIQSQDDRYADDDDEAHIAKLLEMDAQMQADKDKLLHELMESQAGDKNA